MGAGMGSAKTFSSMRGIQHFSATPLNTVRVPPVSFTFPANVAPQDLGHWHAPLRTWEEALGALELPSARALRPVRQILGMSAAVACSRRPHVV